MLKWVAKYTLLLLLYLSGLPTVKCKDINTTISALIVGKLIMDAFKIDHDLKSSDHSPLIWS